MKRYSAERKESVIQKMMPPHNIPIPRLAEETGISEVTLYNWRRQARVEGIAVPADGKNPEKWSSEDKFAIVLEAASLNEAGLAEYCRRKGLYAEQIEAWRKALRHRDVPPLTPVTGSPRNTRHFSKWRADVAGSNQTGQDGLVDCRVNSWMAVLGFALFSAAAQASGPERLADFFDGLTTLRAEFRQTVQDVRLNVNEQASGTVMIQRPGRFRWDYREPYEQLIVADGEKIWMYDVDLEQITVKPLDDTLGDTPAQLLSTTRPLEESFTVFDDGQADGLEWARLLPKSKDGNFQQVRLGFDGQTLRRMELQDSFNQTTRLDFSAVERNPPLDPAAFRFVPPPGVDVVGE